ncbi:MAG: sulfotransferase family 2 domain-containing protein [Rhizobiaceae bacterium]|nr:sulfotransferase family 2 domain-containing protein [Rhizobiaceae bacterium]
MNIKFSIGKLRRNRPYGIWENVYFHHIGKTAGTSFTRLLNSKFHRSTIFPNSGPSRNILHERMENYQFFSGHFPFVFTKLLPQPTLSFTVLREPKEVVLSAYNHLHRLGGKHISFHHRIGRPLENFDDFLSDRILRNYNTNPQTYSLGSELTLQQFFREVAKIPTCDWNSPDSPSVHSQCNLMYGSVGSNKHDPSLLKNALYRIDNEITLCGTVERSDELIRDLEHALGEPFEQKLSHSNVSNEGSLSISDLSPAQLSELENMTELDQRLFEAANQRLDTA